MENAHYTLMFDGGSRGNPGICGSGFVIYEDQLPKWQGYKKVSENNTNNFSEYMGIILGMAYSIEKDIKNLHIKGDSLLVINQLLGKWKVKSPNLKPLYKKATELMKEFDVLTISHVKRDKNKAADSLANKAMDE